MRESKNYRRRNVIKSIGASVVGSTALAGVGAADEKTEREFKADIRRARELRDKRAKRNVAANERKVNPNDAFVKYLRNKGYGVGTNTVISSFTFGSDGPSTEKLEPNDGDELYATINLTDWHSQCDPDPWKMYAEYYWEWDVDSGDGERADDLFCFAWPDEAAEIISDSWESSDNCRMYDRDNDLNGISFKYDDTVLSAPDYDHGYGGVDMEPLSGLSDDDTWAGKWDHTYQELEVCGFSASSDGSMSVSYCTSGKSDKGGYTQTDHADTDHNYNNC